jgi:hypothetical protein
MTPEIVRDAPPSAWARVLLLGSVLFAVLSVLLLTTSL